MEKIFFRNSNISELQGYLVICHNFQTSDINFIVPSFSDPDTNTFKSQLPLDSSKELFAPKQLNQGLIFHFPGARCQACIQCQH